jgi:PAS domain S-box-containing protein
MLSSLTVIEFIALLLMSSLGVSHVKTDEPKPARRILILYPESDNKPGITLFDQSLRSMLEKSTQERIEFYNEYLDASRFSDEGYHRQYAAFLKQKYANRKIDVVVAVMMPSLEFIQKYRQTIFPGVPTIFAAIEQTELANLALERDVIGIPMRFEFVPTLQLALRLQPNTQNVVVISGASRYDQFWEQQAKQSFQSYADKLKFLYLSGLSTDELLQELPRIPPDSIIYYLHVFSDHYGHAYTPANVLETLSENALTPIYGHVDTYLGRGIVGGRLMSFKTEGKNAAHLALRLLRGERPEDAAQQTAVENNTEVDWRQLRLWEILEDDLPAGTIVHFQEPSLWANYKWHVLAVISLCVVEALLITGLVLQRASRRKAEGRFRLSVESAPYGMIMIDRDGHIVLANIQMEKLFGYQREELLGASLELLVPERLRKDNPDSHRSCFFAAPSPRAMGAGRDLFGRRKDGSEFPIEIGRSPILTEAHPFVLATIIDISQRKRAERTLHDTNQELLALTGKLISAQENERRRIARELHDDLNQNLALLSVELDLLGQKPPEPVHELTARLDELSSRVKQMSSSVHGLSYQLHPAKVEQLGLVPALKSLCKELNKSHDVEIDFVAEQVPPSIPTNIALCFYRIAQESLRNVIKHSTAKGAKVELRGSIQELSMSVSDDGVGFDLNSILKDKGLGILSMRERLRLVNGKLSIDALPQHGTRIDVNVPLSYAAFLQEEEARKEEAGIAETSPELTRETSSNRGGDDFIAD